MKTNLSGIADALGKSIPTVKSYIKQGLPYEQAGDQGSEWVFSIPTVNQWYIRREIEKGLPDLVTPNTPQDNAAELKRRKYEAETKIAEVDLEKKEIELAEKKGLLVLIEDANAAIVDAVTTLRQKLLTVPRRVTPLILGETDERIAKELIEKEIIDALEDLSRGFEGESIAETSEETTP